MKYKNISGYKYELVEDVQVKLEASSDLYFEHYMFRLEDDVLTIRAGYTWDGASGPTIDTQDTMLAGLVHDVLYQAIRLGIAPRNSKSIADFNLFLLMVRFKKNQRCDSFFRIFRLIRAVCFYAGVTLFGGYAVKAKKLGEANETIHEI